MVKKKDQSKEKPDKPQPITPELLESLVGKKDLERIRRGIVVIW